MKSVKVIAPFALSGLLFVLAYFSSLESNSGYFPVMLMGIGLILAIVGIAAVFADK